MMLGLNHHKGPLGRTREQVPGGGGITRWDWECPSPHSEEVTIIHQSSSLPQGFPKTSSPEPTWQVLSPRATLHLDSRWTEADPIFQDHGENPRRGRVLEDPSVFRMVPTSSATLHLSFTRFCDLRTCVKSSATINSNIQVWLFKLLFQKYFKMH